MRSFHQKMMLSELPPAGSGCRPNSCLRVRAVRRGLALHRDRVQTIFFFIDNFQARLCGARYQLFQAKHMNITTAMPIGLDARHDELHSSMITRCYVFHTLCYIESAERLTARMPARAIISDFATKMLDYLFQPHFLFFSFFSFLSFFLSFFFF